MACIWRSRLTSADDGLDPEKLPCIRDGAAMFRDLRRCFGRLAPSAGVTKRGERAGHAPQRIKEVSYFDSAGEAAAGIGWPSGVSGGCGLVGFALRTRPRNGCRPNCASFSERRP